MKEGKSIEVTSISQLLIPQQPKFQNRVRTSNSKDFHTSENKSRKLSGLTKEGKSIEVTNISQMQTGEAPLSKSRR
jgi:hypothetical protein